MAAVPRPDRQVDTMIVFWIVLASGILATFAVERSRRRRFMRRAAAGDVRPDEYGAAEHDLTPLGAEIIMREGLRR
jgi:hypothetical protein